MDLDTRIRKLARAVKCCKPDKCEGCKFIHYDSFASSCTLSDRGSWDAVINYELDNGEVADWCPLLEKDSEEYNEIVEQLELMVELKLSRKKLQEIEKITREAFNNPDTKDLYLYRAQALAKIFQIFEYNGATIGEAKEVKL